MALTVDTERPSIHGSRGVVVGDDAFQVNTYLVKPVVWVPLLLLLLVSSAGATFLIVTEATTDGAARADARYTTGPTIVPSAQASAVAAPADSPPVIVENVTPMRSNDAAGDFAMADAWTMTEQQLDEFNRVAEERSHRYDDWYTGHKGTAVDFGVTTFTVRGNAGEQVRITDMRAVKTCEPPLSGTYYAGYTQGTGDTLRIGFDLDAADPVAQQLGHRSGGLFATGEPFFTAKVVTLNPGEKETFAVGAFTRTRSCTFSIRIVVATARGTFFQDITYNGQPFRVTATAPAAANGGPLSGYQRAYAFIATHGGSDGSWVPVDPATHGRR